MKNSILAAVAMIALVMLQGFFKTIEIADAEVEEARRIDIVAHQKERAERREDAQKLINLYRSAQYMTGFGQMAQTTQNNGQE